MSLMPIRASTVPKLTRSPGATSRFHRRNGWNPEQHAPLDNVDSRTVLAASIAHEVNQPLSGIITDASTCLRMLSADPPNLDGARETARRTIRDANRAAEIINRMRVLFAGAAIGTEPVDLNEAVLEALALSHCELDAGRVTVRCVLADGLPLVTGDRVQLQQVILNLVRNAAEAMIGLQDGPRELTITTRRHEDDQVQIRVRDAGIGFRCEDADKLFAPFYTTKARGMGIGLSVSRLIVESHCGRLWGSPNDDGPGATFSLSIPCGFRQSTPRAAAGGRLIEAAGAVALASGS
jgi:C4-dicarboxylate-specific signal transduction histidine kinase